MEGIESLFKTSIDEIERILSTKTVVGEPMAFDGTTVIPLVSVGFGFGVGSGEGLAPNSKKDDKAVEGRGGGTGGGGGIKPVGMIVIDENGVRLEPVKGGTSSVLEKAVETFAAARSKKEAADED